MEEDIKYLDKMVKEYKQFGDLHNPDYEDTDRIYQAIENLIKGYRELERKFKIKTGDVDYLENKISKHFIDDFTLQRDYTPKSKIKEKIEGLEHDIENNKNYIKQGIETDTEYYDTIAKEYAVDILQELMEDK